MLDYIKSKERLIERVKAIYLYERCNTSRTEEAKWLTELVSLLDVTAEALSQERYSFFADAYNQRFRDHIDADGWLNYGPMPAVSYAGTRHALLALADFARDYKIRLPKPREKKAARFAADAILHFLYESGSSKPTIYNNSTAVNELKSVCDQAGVVLSRERLRGLLAERLQIFDPTWFSDGIRETMVFYKVNSAQE